MCNVLNFSNDLKGMIEEIPKKVEELKAKVEEHEAIENDLLHLLENRHGELKAYRLTKIGKKISDNRVERRAIKHELIKWRHLKKIYYDKHDTSRNDLLTAGGQIRKEGESQKKKLNNKRGSYRPRYFKDLYSDELIDNF